ncbi:MULTISPECIES: caspase family protein [unclassified Streptomyces]|uniref:caspase family protein n=1 Tax=unclassified Streptomyces TaxID=2593676 RepID=UPI00278BC038|nr:MULTISPECIES: caspase family protein [unclassified Streptomyces]
MTAERPADPTEPRRFLLAAAVTDVYAHPEDARPELADDVRRMEKLFLDELGFERGAELPANPTRQELESGIRAFAMHPDRGPDDYVVLYLACHGVVPEYSGEHYLLLADSDDADLLGTALPADRLVAHLWEGTAIERVLVVLDTCYAETGTDAAARGALDVRRGRVAGTGHGSTGLVLVASARHTEQAQAGDLSKAFVRAVHDLATAGNAPAHIAIGDVMDAIDRDPGAAPSQRVTWGLLQGSGRIPDFLPNPRHVPGAADSRIDDIQRRSDLRAREKRAREQELRTFFAPRARGTDVATEDVWNFTGRHTALGDLTSWLGPGRAEERLCVVTGLPGSGKSALLGLVAVLSDPARRDSVPTEGLPEALPEVGAVTVAVDASHKTRRQILDAISAGAGGAAGSLGELAAHLQTRTDSLVVLVDSLDEALDPDEIVDELLAPLVDPARRLPLRLLVGGRPHIARRFPDAARFVDLDDDRYADPAAVRAYIRTLLGDRDSVLKGADPQRVDAIADAVAESAGLSFLVALITSRTIARGPGIPDPYDAEWRAALPRFPGPAMERDLAGRLGPLADKARDLLLPLAFAQGAGLPWAGIWPRLASALAGTEYTTEDVVWLRAEAGSYFVEAVEDGGSVYRVYHRALIEHLREGRDERAVQRTVSEVLSDVQHAYVRRYLALHAAEGGVLDPLLDDAGFVLGSAPGPLLAALPRARTTQGRRAAQAVRDMETELRDVDGTGATDPELRARLRLAAVCRKADTLARSCDAGAQPQPLPWRARWAAWNPQEGPWWYEGMAGRPEVGVVILVAGGRGAMYFELRAGAETRAWMDLESGEWRDLGGVPDGVQGRTLVSPGQLPLSVAALAHEQNWEGGLDPEVRHVRLLHMRGIHRWTWELAAQPDFDPEAGLRPLRQARAVQVTGGIEAAEGSLVPAHAYLHFPQGTVLVYELHERETDDRGRLTRSQVRRLGHETALRFMNQQDRHPSTFVGAFGIHRLSLDDARVTACLAPAGLRGEALIGYEDGTVARVVGADATVRVTTGHTTAVTALAAIPGHAQGPLVVAAAEDGSVRLASLRTGEPVRTLLTGVGRVADLAVSRTERQWIVAVATTGGQLHRLDADSGRPLGLPQRIDTGDTTRLATFTLGSTRCVSVQGDTHGLQLYDLVTGDQVGGQRERHEASALCALDGGTVCVGGTDGVLRLWPTPYAADVVSVNAHEGPVLAVGEVHGPDGARALVSVGEDHDIRCWDPVTPRELWHHPAPDRPPWEVPLIACAAVGDDYVATGEHGGDVRVLELRHGLRYRERQFTVPYPERVTALGAGRARGRAVVVAGTDTGRLLCWDVAAGHAAGASAATGTEVTALACDGSGRLAVGDESGGVQEWALPELRPLWERRAAHGLAVEALAVADGGPVSAGRGGDVVTADGVRRRMPRVITAAAADATGPLGADTEGRVWRLDGAEGAAPEEALDAPRPVSALAVLPGGAVAVGGPDGTVVMRDADDGTPTGRLRPLCESGVRELAWDPGLLTGAGLFARSRWGLVERWDVTPDGRIDATLGTPDYETLADHEGWLARREGDRADGAVWEFERSGAGYRLRDHPARWHLPMRREVLDVFPVPGTGHFLVVDPKSGLLRYDTAELRRWLYPDRPRGTGRKTVILRPVETHEPPLRRPTHATPLPGTGLGALAAGDTVSLIGLADVEERHRIALPAPCTALASGPRGELAVGTRGGLLLFDRL